MTYDQAKALAPLIDGKRIEHLDALEVEALEALQAEGAADVVAADPDDPNSTAQMVAIAIGS